MPEENDPCQEMPRILAKLAGRRPALFLDFDGTLAPIVPRAADARALPQAVTAIGTLRQAGMPVVLVTGRARADLVQRLASSGLEPEGLLIAGSHGYEIEGSGIASPPVANAETRARLAVAFEPLRQRLAHFQGTEIEGKAFAIAVHWRHADPNDVPAIEAVIDALVREVPGLRKTHGKMVFELRPDVAWDKGAAVTWILAQWDDPLIMPIFIGDDVTDIDGLDAVRVGGIGIAVGSAIPPGHAHYRLPDPEGVARFLGMLGTFSVQT
ncbi:trehalose 6-phosphate phosphatase/alpha,alpha-trehalase [Arboricoccus pini]|uniref:Trehalose 6-phosphate phosphatase n=1 Tax=Arboricoccus pini TaxID=1963835 RepID=A0A212QCF1_9PROT|nr:trehalose-phosphatase [Arboricoccus pini]SNB57085.1 trehalose 6-phosphate phosphatase/alpha,alpha-trehalase [Arboricoccus pini]